MSRAAEIGKEHGEELVREHLNRTLQDLAKKAPTSLAAHAALFHRTNEDVPLIPAPHHREWVRFLQARERFRWLCVVAPPGYAKSSWFSIAYASWRIGVTKGRVRIGLVSNTATQAQGFGRSVADAIENPRFEKVYGIGPNPKIGWSLEQMWTTGAIDKTNPNLLCAGVGGPIVGKRFDEIILDDPTTWEEARSQTIMEGQKFWLKTTLLERFPPGLKPPDGEGRMVVVLTRWGDRDLVETLRELGFKIVTMPALGWWDREATCATCERERDPDPFKIVLRCEHCDSAEPPKITWGDEPLWGTLESRATLLQQREEDTIIFDLVKQGDPKAIGGDIFDVSMINYGLPPRQFDQVLQFVDTAGGKDRQKGDYFVIVTMGIRKGGEEIWILDVFRERIPAPEQERAVIEKFREFRNAGHAPRVIVESKNEGHALYQRLIISKEERVVIEEFDPGITDKEYRAAPFAQVVNKGRVWVPAVQQGQDLVPVRWVRSFQAELAAFPQGAHDDQVDAASGAYLKTATGGPRIRVLTAGGR